MLYIFSTFCVHFLYTSCTFLVHFLYTSCTLLVHFLDISCTLLVHFSASWEAILFPSFSRPSRADRFSECPRPVLSLSGRNRPGTMCFAAQMFPTVSKRFIVRLMWATKYTRMIYSLQTSSSSVVSWDTTESRYLGRCTTLGAMCLVL